MGRRTGRTSKSRRGQIQELLARRRGIGVKDRGRAQAADWTWDRTSERMTLESILPVRPETPCAPLVVAFEVAIERTGLRVVEFRVDWGRDRERREIAELEQVAAMLLDLWERGWPASRPSFLRPG